MQKKITLEELEKEFECGEIDIKQFEIAKDIDLYIVTEDVGLFFYQIEKHLDIKNIKSVTYADNEPEEYDGAYAVELKNDETVYFAWIDCSNDLTKYEI